MLTHLWMQYVYVCVCVCACVCKNLFSIDWRCTVINGKRNNFYFLLLLFLLIMVFVGAASIASSSVLWARLPSLMPMNFTIRSWELLYPNQKESAQPATYATIWSIFCPLLVLSLISIIGYHTEAYTLGNYFCPFSFIASHIFHWFLIILHGLCSRHHHPAKW